VKLVIKALEAEYVVPAGKYFRDAELEFTKRAARPFLAFS
jgi:hypothetical protein